MLAHVVAEVFEESHFLVEIFWIHLDRVIVLLAVALDVLHVSKTKHTHVT